jgi:hypothetical protein
MDSNMLGFKAVTLCENFFQVDETFGQKAPSQLAQQIQKAFSFLWL